MDRVSPSSPRVLRPYAIWFNAWKMLLVDPHSLADGIRVTRDVPVQPRNSSLLMEVPERTAWLCQA
jgi:hypothetical protein